ncbi:MAG: hypothetical protein R3C53_26140 [Pirellulaceae bacterium]
MDGSSTDRVDQTGLAREPVDILGISKRLQKDPRWPEIIEPLRTKMMKERRQKGLSKAEAQAETYSELDRLYPPLEAPAEALEAQFAAADRGVSGLCELPEDWTELPANASLQVEIAWVSANRLRVRSGTGVDLSKAMSPAPSYSALSWLETSILFPSKFADISVKATAQQDDEKEHIRREKLAIAEIRELLEEMLEDGDCDS